MIHVSREPLWHTPRVIFEAVGEGRPYPDHGRVTARDDHLVLATDSSAAVPPIDWLDASTRIVRLDERTTTRSTRASPRPPGRPHPTSRPFDLRAVLADDCTSSGDLFAHVVQWRGRFHLENGLHRALRTALARRPLLHARVLVHGPA